MKVVFAAGEGDWLARVLTLNGGNNRLRSFYYTQHWPEGRLALEKATGLCPEHARAVRTWDNTTHDKRRVLEVIKRAKAPEPCE